VRTTLKTAAALAVAALALAGCGTQAATQGNAKPLVAATQPSPPVAAQPGIGSTFTVKATDIGGSPMYTIKIKLDKVSEPAKPDPESVMPDGTNLSAARAGRHIAAAEFTWTTITSNDGQGTAPSSIVEFSAKGSDGHHYRPSLGVGAGNGIDSQDPNLGEAASGTVSFEVPNGVRLVYVKYAPLGGSDNTWYIHSPAPAGAARPAPKVTTTAPAAAPVPAKTVYVPAPAQPAAPAATGLTNCTGGQYHYDTVWAGSGTSCAFALNVAASYPGGPGVVNVYSPVTGQTYALTYQIVGAGTVIATGGNNAFVQF
jgi:Domain of unknown function (DUF1942)